jgi:UDPglucose 6-dehydrogenase
MKPPLVGFAGMTHLGLVSASALAGRGFEVVCFDSDQALIGRLARRDWPVLEPGLDALICANGARQRFTSTRDELSFCDLVYVAPDVPTDEQGKIELSGLTALIRDVAAVMSSESLLVVLSQVPPGYTRGLDLWPPERLFYQVETLVFGQAVERAMRPERIIVGCADPSTHLEPRYRAVLEAFGCPVMPMRYESAELAKISINCCLVSSVTVSNTLAELCERIGADWSEIAPALRLDRRIGAYAYLSPGLGIAGGNLERDLATIQSLSEAYGTDSGLITAALRNSRYRRDWPLRQLHARVLSRVAEPVIAVLGVTYKENTHSIKNSPAVALIEQLRGCRITVFDPAVRPSSQWHPRMTVADDPLACCDDADALAIMTPWPQFRLLRPSEVGERMRGRVVVDPTSVLDRAAAAAAGLEHVVLGASPAVASPDERAAGAEQAAAEQ